MLETKTRVPRMTGLPWQTVGSICRREFARARYPQARDWQVSVGKPSPWNWRVGTGFHAVECTRGRGFCPAGATEPVLDRGSLVRSKFPGPVTRTKDPRSSTRLGSSSPCQVIPASSFFEQARREARGGATGRGALLNPPAGRIRRGPSGRSRRTANRRRPRAGCFRGLPSFADPRSARRGNRGPAGRGG